MGAGGPTHHTSMRCSPVLCFLLLAASLAGRPAFAVGSIQEPGAADPAPLDGRSSRSDYVLRARLDESKLLEGEMELTWTNRSGEPVQDLWFHLHLNAYANNLSTHLYESRGLLRGVEKVSGWGYQEVTGIRVGGEDVLPTLQFRHPDEERDADRTVISVDLPKPVAPGETIRVDLEWRSQIPRVRRRTGHHGDFLLMSHWFPKLGVYEAGRGWNCHQFHMNTEFYADYGTYDVTLDLPGKYAGLDDETKKIVFKGAATGELVEAPKVSGGRVEVRFLAPCEEDRKYVDPVTQSSGTQLSPLVHGFAWTADPDFYVYEKRFEFAQWAEEHHSEVQAAAIAFQRPLEEIQLRDVDVTVLMQPERAGQAERHFDATCAALFFYGLWWGEYPYSHITCVDPAWGASAAGGMEYPGIFTAGTKMFTEQAMHRPEGVTVHEAGHQFWYGLVGNNEYEAAWLDEGFNSFTDSEVLFRHYGLRRGATWYAGLPEWGVPPAPAPSMDLFDVPLGSYIGRLVGKQTPDWLRDLQLQPLRLSGFHKWWRDQPRLTFVEQYDDTRWTDRSGYLRSPDVDPIDTVAFRHLNRSSYSTNSYPRTAAALRTLAGVVGRDAFLRGMRGYSERWRYRHPYPEDFYGAFVEFSGTDVGWYFEDVFRGNATADYSVRVRQDREPKFQGLERVDGEWVEPNDEPADGLDDGAAGSTEDPEGGARDDVAAGDEPGAEDAKEDSPAQRARRFDVVVQRKGTLRLPLTIAVNFDDETSETFTWTREAQAESTWWRIPILSREAAIASVILDPDRVYYLDGDMSNNQWYAAPDSLAPMRWGERVWTRYAHLFQWASTLGG